MSRVAPRKEFSVERLLRQQRTGAAPDEAFDEPLDVSNAGLKQLLDAIEGLRAEVADLKQSGVPVSSGNSGAAPLPDDDADEMGKDVRIEIAQMVRAIAKTKLEIAQIKHPLAEQDDQLESTHGELDAIVQATEMATQSILDATEQMEGMLANIAGLAGEDQEIIEAVDATSDYLTKIMEACNFQDITGQRITKVLKTVRFIEDRILAMIAIWGPQAFEDLPVQTEEQEGEEHLLQGPQLGNEGISQAEIDALFD